MSLFRVLSVVVVVLLVGYVLFSQLSTGGETLAPDEFVTRYEPDHVLLDVRTPREYEASHLTGAVNLSVAASDFREQARLLPKDQPIYVYCASGARSGRAAGILEAMGFLAVYNVGGMDALAAAGGEVDT